MKRNPEPDPRWVDAVRSLAEHGVSDPGLLVFILTDLDIRLPSGRFELVAGYPLALATVAAALNSDPHAVQAAYIERAARRSDAAKLIAAALDAIPTIRAAVPEAQVGDRVLFGAGPARVVDFAKYLARSGATSLPPPRASPEWKRLIALLHDDGPIDVAAAVVLCRFRRVAFASGEVAEPLEDEDAYSTVAEALGSSYEEVRGRATSRFKAATLVHGPDYARSATELEARLSRLPGVMGVELAADEGAIVAKRRPDGSLPRAPWEAFSEGPTSMRWRMGPGEDFMMSWQEYWAELDPDDRTFYLAEKQPPPAWHDWTRFWLTQRPDAAPRKIHFYAVNQPFGFMSNFARAEILVDGRRWPTSEHYFQAQKFVGRPEEEQVRGARTPMEAATLGRSLPGLRQDWDDVKDDVMLKALRAKFSQQAYLRTELLATGSAILVEHTRNDAYWADGGDGSGRNRLGELLMQVRAELAAAGQE